MSKALIEGTEYPRVNEDGGLQLTDDLVVQNYVKYFADRTLLTGGAITDNGDGTIAVASGTAWAKDTDSDTAIGRFFSFDADNSVALTDVTTNYIYVDYNDGAPQIVVATSILTHGFKQDHILVGTAFRDGLISHFHHVDTIGIGRIGRVDMHHREEVAVHRVDGIVTSSVGTRNLGITAGVLYEGISRHTTSPFTTPNSGTADGTGTNKLIDSGASFVATDVGKTVHNTSDDTYAEVTARDTGTQLTLSADIFISGENYDLDQFTYWYTTDSGSTWTEVRGATAISNTQYNDITAGLANLTANRYGVHWVYIEVDGEHFHVLYGQGDYKVNEAEEATPPGISPNIVTQYCALIAKIIVQKNTDTLTILFPWTTVFTSSFATDHGSLGGLTDDDHLQYIKDTEFTAADEIIVGTGSGTFGQVTLGASEFLAKKAAGAATNVTAAEAMAVLSGAAAAAFDFNGQAVTGVAQAITDNAILTVDGSPNSGEYGRFTASGLEGRTVAEMLAAISPLTTRGDIMFRNATVSTRLAKGAANTILVMGANDPAWSSTLIGTFLSGCVAGGAWAASGVWTLPLFTLGGNVKVNNKIFDLGSTFASFNTTGGNAGLRVQGSGDPQGPAFVMAHAHTTPQATALLSSWIFEGYDGAAALQNLGAFYMIYTNVGDGTEAMKFQFNMWDSGAANVSAELSGAGELGLDLGVDADEYYKVAGTQVVSAQGAAVANPTDAASTQARLIDLLGRLRTHGLIAT